MLVDALAADVHTAPAGGKRPRTAAATMASSPRAAVPQSAANAATLVAAAAAGAGKLQRPLSRGRAPARGRALAQRGKPRAVPPRGYSDGVGLVVFSGKAADITGLVRRLDDLHARLGPIAAQAHERVAAQLRTLLQPDSRRMLSAATASWANQERARLLLQLEALERMERLPQRQQAQGNAAMEQRSGATLRNNVAVEPRAASLPPTAAQNAAATPASAAAPPAMDGASDALPLLLPPHHSGDDCDDGNLTEDSAFDDA